MIYKPPTFCQIYFLLRLKHKSGFLYWAVDFLTDHINTSKSRFWNEYLYGIFFVFFAMLAAWLYGRQCWSVHHFAPDRNISTTIWWIAMKFCTNIHGAQRMIPADLMMIPWLFL